VSLNGFYGYQNVYSPAVVGCTCVFTESYRLVTTVIMYAFVEEPSRAHCDGSVQSLSWMGKAPEGQPEMGTAWRLSENSYYDEGWLASGNTRGVVGVTMTGCCSTQNLSADVPQRTNFNLRGHRSEVGVWPALKLYFPCLNLMLFVSLGRQIWFMFNMQLWTWFTSDYFVVTSGQFVASSNILLTRFSHWRHLLTMYNNNTNICKVHIVSIRAESEAPAVARWSWWLVVVV